VTALSVYFQSKASGRHVLITFALLVLCVLGFNLVLTPLYQDAASGFVPFDLQFPLTREMIVIQLGAMSDAAPQAYVNFAILDFIFPPLGAAFFVLFWAWLVNKSGSAVLSGIYQRGWWIWALFPCFCDLAENVAFLNIIFTPPGVRPDMLEFVVDVHRGKMVFLTIAQAMTLALLLTSGLLRLRKKS